jgi:hypothetical protein
VPKRVLDEIADSALDLLSIHRELDLGGAVDVDRPPRRGGRALVASSHGAE